jgi:hypothetical protein
MRSERRRADALLKNGLNNTRPTRHQCCKSTCKAANADESQLGINSCSTPPCRHYCSRSPVLTAGNSLVVIGLICGTKVIENCTSARKRQFQTHQGMGRLTNRAVSTFGTGTVNTKATASRLIYAGEHVLGSKMP